jgi:peptide/nickel transport system ATP-binding protein
MGVVARMAHRVAVMYAGQIMETSDVQTLFYTPKHPYTKALLQCLPKIGASQPIEPIPGAAPQVGRLLGKCPFLPRCTSAMRVCAEKEVCLKQVGPQHTVRCHMEMVP